MKLIRDINWLFNKYYSDNPELYRIVRIHSEQVAKKALAIWREKKLKLDPVNIYCAAVLHDIGVVKCNAPDIHAFGELPYLYHGIEGKKILLNHNLPQFANICSTHTGAGISIEDIRNNNLQMPEGDYLPFTLLEKLICYADKFYSKSGDLYHEKDIESVISQMKKFGEGSYNRFMEMNRLFSTSSS